MSNSLGAFIAFDAASATYTIKPGAATNEIQNLLNNAAVGTKFHFSEGTHTLTTGLVVKTDGIEISGAGGDKTKFLFAYSGTPTDGITVEGVSTSLTNTLSGSAAAGAKTITLNSTAGLKAGDILHLQQQNTTDWLLDNGYDNVVGTSNGAKNPINETVVEIQSISGNVVTLKTAITHDLSAAETTIKLIDAVKDVSLSGFTMTYNLGTPDYDDFSNPLSNYSGNSAIYFERTVDASVKDVTVLNAPSNGLQFRTSLTPDVDGFTMDGAFNKGDAGNGYALQVAETYYGNFQNLVLMNTRHAFVFSSWHTEVGNNVHVLETNRDINYHGGPDYGNVVIVDRDIYRQGDTTWRIVSPGGSMHPYTDISQNTTKFGVAAAGDKADVIYGWDSGSWLSGGLGKDELHGGAGNDILIGGKEYDALSGGAGRDIFAFTAGDGRDTIADFKAGANGDIFAVKGYTGVDSFDDLVLTDRGTYTRITVNGEVLADLTGVKMADLTADNFMFNNSTIYQIPAKVVAPPPPTTPTTPPPTPTPVAGIDVKATSKADVIEGTAGDDKVSGYMGQINTTDVIKLGAGTDTLLIQSTGLTFDSRTFKGLSGIDVIDITASTGKAKIIIDEAFLKSTDAGAVKILYGAAGVGSIDTTYVTSAYDVVNGTNYTIVKLKDVVTPPPVVVTPPPVVVEPLPEVEVPSVPGVMASLSSKVETFTGTAGDDTVKGYSSQIQTTDTINMGDGHDTVQFLSSMASWDSRAYTLMNGVDHLDLSASTKKTSVILDQGFMDRTDDGSLQVSFGTAGITLDTSRLAAGTYDAVWGADSVTVTMKSAATALASNIFNISPSAGTSSSLLPTTNTQFSSIVEGDNAQNILKGTSEADALYGYGGDDSLYGGAGNDLLSGGLGKDSLTGGGGADIFAYAGALEGGDVILDFESGKDHIDLTALMEANGLGQVQDAVASGHVRLGQSGADATISFDTDGAGQGQAVLLATVKNALPDDLLNSGSLIS